ncbi:MAG TPA: GNAT family N-acetyltransferase [Gemmatimonadaceae bacterium]|nr:GNAT family N-acetyltransferase [Gemmatimonadaceae bacterium]
MITAPPSIRICTSEDRDRIFEIVNQAAQVYRETIPADRWHEPYMPMEELESEIADGVTFWGYEVDGELVGVMGIQNVRDVDLIRHAYVLTGQQGRGVGGELIKHLQKIATRPMLVGTWADATWAIRFYERHGFELVSRADTDRLLRKYWSIPERQIETSVVLADSSFKRNDYVA